MTDQAPISIGFVISAWLERINGKHGFADELLTPLPIGLGGIMVLIERAWA